MIDLNKYFDEIYCINLDRRKDRYGLFLQEVNKYNISNINRFSAIDGNTLAGEYPILKGELGVLESHLKIISEAKDKNLSSVLIMEDDVIFSDEIYKLDEYMSLVPKDWDMIYFGGNHIYGPKPIRINQKVLKLEYTVALQCVAIKNTVFDAILALLPLRKKQVDTYYGQLQNGYNAYGFYPSMAKQRVGFSDIQNRIVDYNNFFID